MNVMLAADLRTLEGLLRILTSQVSLIVDESSVGFMTSIPKRAERLARCRDDMQDTVLEIRRGCIAALVDHRPSGTGLKYLLLLEETATSLGAVGATMSAIGDLGSPDGVDAVRMDSSLTGLRGLTDRVKALVHRGADAVWSADDYSAALARKHAREVQAGCAQLSDEMRQLAGSGRAQAEASWVISGCQLIECVCHRIIGIADRAERLFGDSTRGVLPFMSATEEPRPPARPRTRAGSVP